MYITPPTQQGLAGAQQHVAGDVPGGALPVSAGAGGAVGTNAYAPIAAQIVPTYHTNALSTHTSLTFFSSPITRQPTQQRGANIAHFGLSRPGHRPGSAKAGGVAQKAMESEKGNYLANLILYPGGWLALAVV
jgi:hypothetical protein